MPSSSSSMKRKAKDLRWPKDFWSYILRSEPAGPAPNVVGRVPSRGAGQEKKALVQHKTVCGARRRVDRRHLFQIIGFTSLHRKWTWGEHPQNIRNIANSQ